VSDIVAEISAASVEQGAAAAESPRHQAEQLVSAVSVFNLGDKGCASYPAPAPRAQFL
jgi:hypothetical protein